MNKKSLLIVSTILLLIIGGVVYLVVNSADENSNQESVSQSNQTSNQEQSVQETDSLQDAEPSGAYIDYDDQVIANTDGTKLLFFHAPWCPQCRELEADIKSEGVPEGVAIIKVDYDSNQALRQKYGVTLQTTIVKVDDEGNLVSKFVAYEDPSVSAIRQNLL